MAIRGLKKNTKRSKRYTTTNVPIQAAAAEKMMEGIPEMIIVDVPKPDPAYPGCGTHKECTNCEPKAESPINKDVLDEELIAMMHRRAGGPLGVFTGFFTGLAKGFSICLAIWFALDANTSYMQVPGGWIYRYMGGNNNTSTMVFVPFGHVLPYTITPATPTQPRIQEHG